jgi:Protein of unknown function (DUF4446)
MIILTILFCISLAALGYTQWRFLQLQKQYGEFLQGADAKKIEDLIKSYSGDVKDSLQKLDELAGFNPFGDTGGDQSFVLAVLDNHNNGVILSSIHARTGTRMYAKEITNGLSKYNLSDEETVALQKALNSKKKQEKITNA